MKILILISFLLSLSLSICAQDRKSNITSSSHQKSEAPTITYKKIAKQVKEYLKNPEKKKLVKIFRNYIIVHSSDKSYYSYEMLLPIYKTDKKILLLTIKASPLNQKSKDIISNNISLMLREFNEGNDF